MPINEIVSEGALVMLKCTKANYQVLLVQSLLTYWWKNFSYMLCGANTAYINYFSKIIITLREVNTGASSCVSEEKN